LSTTSSRGGREERRLALEAELGEEVTCDGLTAATWIFQRRRGHRHSTDDLLTGWYALEKSGDVPALLDLGTGIGTVGLLALSGMSPDARLTCIEAQAVSFRLLLENVAINGLGDRIEAIFGDLRDLALGRTFPLVTGSPPYFEPGTGIIPADSQKAHARFELRGDVGDYARAARRHLAPGGRFVFCFPWPQKARAVRAVTAEGFAIVAHRDVVPREGIAPLFSLFACEVGAAPTPEAEPAFVVRDRDGAHTVDMLGVRARFGWPPEGTSQPRPC
jgi:tRNA1Val (adenine37-N6)-methyltransferase